LILRKKTISARKFGQVSPFGDFSPKKKEAAWELKSEELSPSPGINLRKLQQGCFPFIFESTSLHKRCLAH
jgi:hypothetical protein